jgi:hypothetical protein
MKLFGKLKRFIDHPFKNKALFSVLFVAILFAVTFMFLYKIPDDPDLGWHIASGAREWGTHSIPRVDWFSFTFSDFRWVDHEYLSNVIIYGLNHAFGRVGISVFYTLLACITLFVGLKYSAVEKISWTHAALYGALVSPMFLYYVGARPQVLPWLFVTLVFASAASLKRNKKSKFVYFLPFIFLAWANLHGGSVAIGLVILGTFVVIEGLKVWYFLDGEDNAFLKSVNAFTLKSYQKFVGLALVSVAATLANPYGYRIYEEFLRTVTDTYSLSRINEWLPPNFTQPTGVLLLIFLFVVVEAIYLEYKNKIDFTYMVFFFGFLFLSSQSVRHIPLFALVMSPFLLGSTKKFFDVYLEPIFQKKIMFILVMGTLVLAFVRYNSFFDRWQTSFSESAIASEGNYPEGAVAYIRSHPIEGNMFNIYNWGGYLIENLPEHKVFIDGRMPHWRNKNLQVFKDYNTIVNTDPLFQTEVDRYQIGFFMIGHGGSLESKLQGSSDWKQVYSDSTAVIFVKNNE